MHEKKTTVLTRATISASFLFAHSLFHGSLRGVLKVLRSDIALLFFAKNTAFKG
jgi:hypothetical protein